MKIINVPSVGLRHRGFPSSGDELAGVQLKEKDGQGWNESCGDGRKGKSE